MHRCMLPIPTGNFNEYIDHCIGEGAGYGLKPAMA